MANFEIRANIKFLTKLNWKPVKFIKALQQVYGEPHHVEQSFIIGLNASRRKGSNLKMIQERGDPPPQKIKKISGLCRI